MKKKYSLILDSEFIQYCKLNNIVDIEGKAKEVFTQGFTILKYGLQPNIFKMTNTMEEMNLESPIDTSVLSTVISKQSELLKKKDIYGE